MTLTSPLRKASVLAAVAAVVLTFSACNGQSKDSNPERPATSEGAATDAEEPVTDEPAAADVPTGEPRGAVEIDDHGPRRDVGTAGRRPRSSAPGQGIGCGNANKVTVSVVCPTDQGPALRVARSA